MKKLIATVSGVAGALAATCFAFSPPAVADTCPYDMSTPAGHQAVVDAMVAASNQVRSDEASMGPLGNQALADKDQKIEADNSRMMLACSGKESAASDQALNGSDQAVARDQAAAKQQAADQAAMNAPRPAVDFGDPKQANNNGACANLANMYAGPDDGSPAQQTLNGAANAFPGVGQGEGLTQIGCAVGDIPNDVMNPSGANMGDTAGGVCNAITGLTTIPFTKIPILGDPCGNTPAG
jgi:hypothetical protein